MSTDVESGQQTLEFEGGDSFEEFGGPEAVFGTADFDDERPLRPIDWNTLTADEALVEWGDLDKFVKWLRLSYGLPPAVVPPLWHRHDELIWELSALHALREAIGRELAGIEQDHERWELQTAALRKSPSLMNGFVTARCADERALVAVLAERLGKDPDSDLSPRLLAHVSNAAVRASVELWVASGRTRTFQSIYRQAFAMLAAGLSD